ncbi:hypothetical protein [Cyclobacterium qasimii]|uniref:Fe/B12 periplasmic-binding domain-containing protein n=1 Tax=Cyclobacterium qasimii M12-11B TaxID=641524 RepID=S7VP96_9BACT|nr:hypothetical protein [Cyclobacterium qasimii]EPR71756.1 hypothetical protein ADICYQ_0004 [Cyclobacterium qasimii M12-11B]
MEIIQNHGENLTGIGKGFKKMVNLMPNIEKISTLQPSLLFNKDFG